MMEKESYSDFSIIKDYIELKNRYDLYLKEHTAKLQAAEEKHSSQLSAVKQEIIKRDDQIKTLENQIQELNQKLAEKDEQIKNMGLQLHKLKASAATQEAQQQPEQSKKKGIFV